ncbi:MAG: thiol-disulfide isomerase/thioredoxin [Planctomycetaceae bacterium]|jgi:thiol-disulfide isomerase/thioredoxin
MRGVNAEMLALRVPKRPESVSSSPVQMTKSTIPGRSMSNPEDAMTNFPLHRMLTAAILAAAIIATATPASQCFADEAPAATFNSIITKQTRATFDLVAKYVVGNGEASDAERAWQWLFLTSMQHGFETEAVELARTYIKSPKASAATRGVAQQTLAIGLAKGGKSDEAVELFTGQLRFARFQSGGALIEFGRRLAVELQLARDFGAARHVYEEIASKFFLNADVRSLCENRIKKMDMVDQKAPEIEGSDIKGGSVSLASLEGKVVLVDFWATNCPPCLEEMPNLKQIYADYHDDGFEILGISLDEDPSIVEQFTAQAKISWPMIVERGTVDTLRASYFVPTIPSLFVVDQSGKLHQFDVRGDDLRKVIEGLLKQ